MLPPQVNDLIDTLRAHEDDPAFADAPVLDVYGRISINPETGETEKFDRQIEDTLREVLLLRARLGEVLRDDGKSAWKAGAKRPGWERSLVRPLVLHTPAPSMLPGRRALATRIAPGPE
ncbi:MAG: invertase Pin-like site-specific recombinase [Actinomycetota bacterium]|nr:invertase Pin-like site-specific recombinase [Actinomycetota bacterium]MDQ1294679.1 invertase Pin-like site-specific recombinase [Actinomycetota bacterium]